MALARHEKTLNERIRLLEKGGRGANAMRDKQTLLEVKRKIQELKDA